MSEHWIELKLSELSSYSSVHHWLADKLNFPAYYGHNLDALWDCLLDLPTPMTILWFNDNQDSNDYSTFTSIFEEASAEVEGLEFGYIMED